MKKSEFIVLRKDEQVNDLSMNELKGGLGGNVGGDCNCSNNCNGNACTEYGNTCGENKNSCRLYDNNTGPKFPLCPTFLVRQ